MSPSNLFAEIADFSGPLHVEAGPLLSSIARFRAGRLGTYLDNGGYRLARQIAGGGRSAQDLLAELETSGLRGRAGGGFPTGHKWSLVASSDFPSRVVVCNAHSSTFDRKQGFLVRNAPHRILEATAVAALAVGAREAYVFLGREAGEEAAVLSGALEEARAAGIFGRDLPLELRIVVSPGGYVTGEETAMLNVLEGRIGQPRGKPPLPTERGLHGRPTLVNNLETLLHALLVLEEGAASFRSVGTRYSPGTLLVTLLGDVERPGIYEVPLGTPIRRLVEENGCGGRGGRAIQAVLPGVSSPILEAADFERLLDFDAMLDAGSAVGSGMLIAVAEDRSILDLAVDLARFFYQESCGKCRPCKDGTHRIWNMLEHLEDLDQPAIDLADRSRPPSLRGKGGLKIVTDDSRAPISYTDTVKGLDKIRHLAEFFKYRGDCRHSYEAASSIQRILERYPDPFLAVVSAKAPEVVASANLADP